MSRAHTGDKSEQGKVVGVTKHQRGVQQRPALVQLYSFVRSLLTSSVPFVTVTVMPTYVASLRACSLTITYVYGVVLT